QGCYNLQKPILLSSCFCSNFRPVLQCANNTLYRRLQQSNHFTNHFILGFDLCKGCQLVITYKYVTINECGFQLWLFTFARLSKASQNQSWFFGIFAK